MAKNIVWILSVIFTRAELALRGYNSHDRVSVGVSVRHTPVLYHNGKT